MLKFEFVNLKNITYLLCKGVVFLFGSTISRDFGPLWQPSHRSAPDSLRSIAKEAKRHHLLPQIGKNRQFHVEWNCSPRSTADSHPHSTHLHPRLNLPVATPPLPRIPNLLRPILPSHSSRGRPRQSSLPAPPFFPPKLTGPRYLPTALLPVHVHKDSWSLIWRSLEGLGCMHIRVSSSNEAKGSDWANPRKRSQVEGPKNGNEG